MELTRFQIVGVQWDGVRAENCVRGRECEISLICRVTVFEEYRSMKKNELGSVLCL